MAKTKETLPKTTTKEPPSYTPVDHPILAQPKQAIDLEMMHQRLGHQSIQSLLAASQSDIWEDVRLRPGPETHCEGCHIATRRKANRTHHTVSTQNYPGQVLFMDLINNPTKLSLLPSLYQPYYLLVIDAYSRFSMITPCPNATTSSIIDVLEKCIYLHRPHKDFTLYDIAEIHVDAGSYFLSEEMIKWGLQYGIIIIAAGAKHQEMNGLPERRWQAVRI